MTKLRFYFICVLCWCLFFSCSTLSNIKVSVVIENDSDGFIKIQPEFEYQKQEISRLIYAKGIKNQQSLYNFFISKCPNKNRAKAKKIAKLYIKECSQEGINSDVAFVQMCLETNFLRYGNLVKPSWNNFCGLGAINKENPGLKFKSMKLGVRAHVQHLHAYGTTSDVVLQNELVDPRYKYVNPRGKAKDVFGLAGTWAADKEYGKKLDKLLKELEQF